MNDDYSTRASDNDSADYSTEAAPANYRHNRHKLVKANVAEAKAQTADVTAQAEDKPIVKHEVPAKHAAAPAHNETVGATEHGSEAAHPWYHETDVWIAVAFFLFLLVAMKYVLPPITKGLDARGAKIRDQLEQANRLKAEAEALLDQYKAEQAKKLAEAESILEAARRDAENIRTRAADDLKQSLARRTAQAEEKIARAEADAVAALRRQMVEAATESARAMLIEKVTSEAADPALARAFRAIETQLGNDDTTTPKRKRA